MIKNSHNFWLILLVSLCFSCQNEEKQLLDSGYNFIDYNYDLNAAMDAKHKADTSSALQHLHQALSFISQQKEVPTQDYLIGSILQLSPQMTEKEVKSFLRKHPFVTSGRDHFYGLFEFNQSLKESVMEHSILESPNKYYHPDHLRLSARMDTLIALDQGILGVEGDQYDRYYSDTLWYLINNIEEGQVYLFNELLKVHDEYGLLGFQSCKECIHLFAMYLHLNKDEIEIIREHLLKCLKKGLITSNQFAVIYDRCYSELGQARKEFYYYFNFYGKSRPKDFKTMDKLSPAEKDIVNQRRKEIGLPPLPYKFIQLRELIN